MKRHWFTSALAIAALVTISASTAWCQTSPDQDPIQIKIVNQDGEEVVPGQVTPPTPRTPDGNQGIRVQAQDGKLVIVDSEGKQRELKIGDARDIIVTQSMQTVDNNGDKQTTKTGKVVIVRPDGTRQEIEIDGDAGMLDWQGSGRFNVVVPQRSGVIKIDPAIGKYYIGVFCKPIDPAMASQLRLQEGQGLIVTDVAEDSPASEAGLETHDVLLFADQQELKSREDLTKRVQQAAEEQAEIKIDYIRGGREASLTIKPAERPAGMMNDVIDVQQMFPNLPQGQFEFRAVEPGVIIGRGAFDQDADLDFDANVQQMEQRMQKLQQQMEQQFEQMKKDLEQQIQRNKK